MSTEPPRIPGYLFVRQIGRGGMGVVWLAKQEATGIPVAVKLMGAEDTEARRHQSEREAVASLNIHHENIVATVAIGRWEGRVWIAMEYAGGGSLLERVRSQGPLTESEAIRVGLDAASGLREATRLSVVHRDVKPSNLLFDEEGRIKVCDLGLVGEAGDAGARLQLGTPRFMAPEQITGDGTVDHRADVYALGLTLYFAATGRSAVDGRDSHEMLRQQRRAPLPDPREISPDLSEGFVNILRRMTEKDPGDRYQLWDELIIDLEHLARGDNPLSAVIAVAKRANVRRRWLVPVSVVLLTLVLVGVGAMVAFRPPEKPPETVDSTGAEARGLLQFIDGEVERGVGPAEATRQYRELVRRYPGTEAATAAAERAEEIESRTVEEFAKASREASRAVRALTTKGRLEAARKALDDARPTLTGADAIRLETELGELVRGVSEGTRKRFDAAMAGGELATARAVVEESEDTELGGLRAWRKQALGKLADAEARRVEASREAARRDYAKVVPTALRVAGEGRGADARALIDRAVGGGGKYLGAWPETDRKILGLVALARGQLVRRGKELANETVAVVRDREILIGRLEELSSKGLRLKGSEETVPLEKLDSETIRSLIGSASSTSLAAFAIARGDAREARARLEGNDSPAAERMRFLAGEVPEDVPAPSPGAKDGETPGAAADRLAGEGRHGAAFRLDPGVAERLPGRDPAAARVLSGRGLDLYVTGELAEADRAFRDAMAKDPFNADVRLHLARVLLDLAARNRSPVLLDRIRMHLDAGDAFRPGLDESARLRTRLGTYRKR